MNRWSISLASLVVGALAGTFVAGPMLHGEDSKNAQTTSVPKELTSYRGVVKQVLPAVVSIESKSKPKLSRHSGQRKSPGGDEQGTSPDDLLRRFLEQQEQQEESPHFSFGSGFVVDPKGVILTNFHVVDGADQVEVTLMDGRKFTSHDIHSDRKTDLAIVRINAQEPLPYLQMGNSDAMEIGDRVLAVGAPFGLTGSVTSGIVSAKGRNLRLNMYEDFLQTDAAINPGNSGGPLVNLEGQVIGINSAIKSRTGGFQGVGMAISSHLAKNVMQQLLQNGVVHRGYLGVSIAAVPAEVAERLGLNPNESGVAVGRVVEGSPAAKAGIRAGDVITSLNHKSIKDGQQLQTMVAELPLNKPTSLMILRDGKRETLQVTILEQPADYGLAEAAPQRVPEMGKQPVGLEKLGLEVTDLSPEIADKLGYKDGEQGAVITKVEPGSRAQEAGLTRGLLIVKVDKTAVTSAESLRKAVDKASMEKGVLLQVKTRNGDTTFVMLKASSEK
jgi:serine protease Do